MAVDVGRGPCRRGYLGERHVLAAESAPLVVKVVQNVPPRVAGACYIFWLCRWSRRENILRAEPPRDTPARQTQPTPPTPQPHTRQAGRLPAPAPRRTPLGAGGEGLGSLRLRHRRPAGADGREDPPGPHRRRPRGQQVPEHGRQAGLREAFCGWMERRHGVTLDPESEVLPATGSKEAIFHAPLAFLHHSHERRGVAYGTPGYPVYERGTLFCRRRGSARGAEMGERFPAAARGDRPRTHADTLDQLPPQPHGRNGNLRVPGKRGRVLPRARHPALLRRVLQRHLLRRAPAFHPGDHHGADPRLLLPLQAQRHDGLPLGHDGRGSRAHQPR